MSGIDDFDDFIKQELEKMDEKENKTINTPTSAIGRIKFPIVPQTDTIKQLNQLPHTPISLNKYHEIFTLFKLYITKSNPGINKRLFVKPSYVSKDVFKETIQLINHLNEFINKMNKAYANKHVYFDHTLYNNDVGLVQSFYQLLIEDIIKNYCRFYNTHRTAIDYVNDSKNITRGAGRKTRKQRQRQRQTRKQKIHKRSTKKHKQIKRKPSKYNSTKKSKSKSKSKSKTKTNLFRL
jgi:hypothetical protein